MRILGLAGVLLVGAAAFAAPAKTVSVKKAVETAIRTNIVKLGELQEDDQLALATDAIVIGQTGLAIRLGEADGCLSGAVADAFYGCVQASISHTPGAITTGIDAARGLAWFQAPYTVTMTGEDENLDEVTSRTPMRVGGIVARRGTTWKIVAALYAQQVTDKELLRGTGGTPADGPPALAGDKKLAGVVAGWFGSGFAPAAAKTGTLIASGTSSAEYRTGKGAVTLARSWDKLKLGATKIDARLLANGAIGWVVADVTLPRRNGKGAVEMKLAAIVVPEGESWRWVSLQYQPGFMVGR